jgi:hypothetical protein
MTWAALVAASEEVRKDAHAPELPIAAIGWATVDSERARADLDAVLSGDPGAPQLQPWAPIERDPDLGARAWARAAADPGGAPALVVLEPDTEGRLAASLARFGEGVAVIYLGEGMPRPGRLLRGGQAWGPHVVVVDSSEQTPP